MSTKYDHQSLEKKWQQFWADDQSYRLDLNSEKLKDKPVKYVLDMFPYPSGQGLHVGHPLAYIATDIYARFSRMNGFAVLHPMGFDAFGLPAENYAIKTGVAPEKSTNQNIKNFTRQLKSIGFDYDWQRVVNTSDPGYYRWTQWLFSQLYQAGLAYKKKSKVNWSPSLQTVLANEQVINGCDERTGQPVIQKELAQWFFKITDFAEDLLTGLDDLNWPNSIKSMQRNWIGRSTGVEVDFKAENGALVKTFTTRPDTLWGVTYLVLAPEHPLVASLTKPAQQAAVTEYLAQTKSKTDLDRGAAKVKTGVFTGSFVINPVNQTKVPVWVADYVLATYGTGAVLAVPAHDQRDWQFAQKFKLPIKFVIKPQDNVELHECYLEAGVLVDSDQFSGLGSQLAIGKITEWLTSQGFGRAKVQYKLRDWLVSRQRYWGVPIPVVYDSQGNPQLVPDQKLPWLLPTDVSFTPTGVSPLAESVELKQRVEKMFGAGYQAEIDTMDTFVCSSWYFFRYLDPNNETSFAEAELIKKWLPVDLYAGGAEHAVLHLLYARFITHFLHRQGVVGFKEPFTQLRNQGMITGENGVKMSKSKGNVVTPDEIIEQYGADTLRLYEMFMGPFADSKPWSTKGIVGIRRFLDRVYRVGFEAKFEEQGFNLPVVGQTITKVTADIENFYFNTAISSLMVCLNKLQAADKILLNDWLVFIKLLSPFAPHLSAELWQQAGQTDSLLEVAWPQVSDLKLAPVTIDQVKIVVQINGKVRSQLLVKPGLSKEEVQTLALADESCQKWLGGAEVVKTILVPDKLLSLVVK